MGLFTRKKEQPRVEPVVHREERREKRDIRGNPHLSASRSGFFSDDLHRLLYGWDSSSATIDYYLRSELTAMRARSRKLVRMNPYGKRFIQTLKANVVGPEGVTIQARVRLRDKPDQSINNAIEQLWRDWGSMHCDRHNRLSFVEMQNLLVSSAAQDGEFMLRVWASGPHDIQLEVIDAELLNIEKNETTKSGEIRLGVEYDKTGRRVRYHFKRKSTPVAGGYDNYNEYTVKADSIIHGFIPEWPDQSRGIPWMHASLERSKHLEKYEESAIVKARSTASTMGLLKTPDGVAEYTGDEDYSDEASLDEFEAGTFKDIGNRDVIQFDSDYPHTMYGPFVKAHLQGIASGLGISYHSLSSDLEGVNYSSIRAGVLEDREIFKGLQNWFIRLVIRPVYEEWVSRQYLAGRILAPSGIRVSRPVTNYLPAHYQGRRWAWVDPQKDSAANQLAISSRLKSRSQIIREQGDDPDSVFEEIQAEEAKLEALGIDVKPVEVQADAPENTDE